MTIDECMAMASAAFDEAMDNAMQDGVRMAFDQGATEEEIESFRVWYAEMLADSRTTNLADIRAWLERGGSKLQ